MIQDFIEVGLRLVDNTVPRLLLGLLPEKSIYNETLYLCMYLRVNIRVHIYCKNSLLKLTESSQGV